MLPLVVVRDGEAIQQLSEWRDGEIKCISHLLPAALVICAVPLNLPAMSKETCSSSPPRLEGSVCGLRDGAQEIREELTCQAVCGDV